jgi:hypothetical protein
MKVSRLILQLNRNQLLFTQIYQQTFKKAKVWVSDLDCH